MKSEESNHVPRLINHLIQLQEMLHVRDEHQARMRRDSLADLDQSIAQLTGELPPAIRAVFEELRRRDPVAIVPITTGVCAGCGLSITLSMKQAVRAQEHIQRCRNCTRILYYSEATARAMRKPASRIAPQKVGVARFSSPALMIPRLTARDRDTAIHEITRKMEEEGFIDSAEKLARAALRREDIVSTAVDHGLAFPHARNVEGGGLTLALGLSPKGVHFDGDSKSRTRIVFFMAIPSAVSTFYLKLLAGLTETFMEAAARRDLLAQDSPPALWKTLVRLTRKHVP